MEFEKISSPSLRELFVQQLEHMILSGKLPVGTKLPPERQLSQEMQVSRAVINLSLIHIYSMDKTPGSGTHTEVRGREISSCRCEKSSLSRIALP